MERTPTHRLIDLRLGGDGALEQFIRTRRLDGVSWRRITRELYEATDQEFDVTYETLRSWFPDVDWTSPAEASA